MTSNSLEGTRGLGFQHQETSTQPSSRNQHICNRRIFVAGDKGVGKTSLWMALLKDASPNPDLTRAMENCWRPKDSRSSMCCQFVEKHEEQTEVNNPDRRCQLLIICFAIDNPESLKDIMDREWMHYWLHSLQLCTPTILVGLKADRRVEEKPKNVVKRAERSSAKSLQKEILHMNEIRGRKRKGMHERLQRYIKKRRYVEVSAETGEGLDRLSELVWEVSTKYREPRCGKPACVIL